MYVFDATPLISLASIDRLELVQALAADCCLPDAVYEEVVTAGIDAGHADARRVEQAIEHGWFSVKSNPDTQLVDKLARSDTLSDADIAVLALAADHDGVAVIDEQYGRTLAETENIATRGTAYIVLTAQQHGLLSATATRDTIDALLDAGWYCAPDLYATIQTKIDEIAARNSDEPD